MWKILTIQSYANVVPAFRNLQHITGQPVPHAVTRITNLLQNAENETDPVFPFEAFTNGRGKPCSHPFQTSLFRPLYEQMD